MKIHGTPVALVEGLQEHLKEGKYPMPQIARIADALYSELYDLFETWGIVENFQFYVEEAGHVIQKEKNDTSCISLPFHIYKKPNADTDENEDIVESSGDYESYREAVAYFRKEYGQALAEEHPDWNEVLTYLCSFSENIRMLFEVLQQERMQSMAGVKTLLEKMISVKIKKK